MKHNYRQLLGDLERLEEGLEQMPPTTSNAAHLARIELANVIARAREILEALAADETDQEERAQ